MVSALSVADNTGSLSEKSASQVRRSLEYPQEGPPKPWMDEFNELVDRVSEPPTEWHTVRRVRFVMTSRGTSTI